MYLSKFKQVATYEQLELTIRISQSHAYANCVQELLIQLNVINSPATFTKTKLFSEPSYTTLTAVLNSGTDVAHIVVYIGAVNADTDPRSFLSSFKSIYINFCKYIIYGTLSYTDCIRH